MAESSSKQKGFGLILIILALLIIALIVFGIMNRPGTLEQSRQIENRAVNDVKNINSNLDKYNQELENSLK